jgi:hypothetical protein
MCLTLPLPQGNRMGRCGLDASGSEEGSVAGSSEYGNEPSGSIKSMEFLN